ncbi:MAG TPA: hypothetical protein VMT32_14240 [Bryobacteraceae bacterium]|nr:hypothetical protein [Bryobacteraceae bacterium]
MDHETAVKTQAAERYILDEFSPEDRTGFEEHFFECVECANDVRAASILAANTKAVIREDEARAAEALRSGGGTKWRLSWGLVASAALNLMLVLGIGLQGWRLGNRAPVAAPMGAHFYHSFGAPAASRGTEKTFEISAGDLFFGTRFDLMPGQHFDRYEYQILDTAGAIRSGQSLNAPAGNDSELELAVPISSLTPGEYTLVLRGVQQGNTIEISRARVLIKR